MSPDRHRQKAIQAVLDAVSRTPAMGMQELSFDPFTGYLLKRATKGEPVLKAGISVTLLTSPVLYLIQLCTQGTFGCHW